MTHKHILLVEDDGIIAARLQEILETWNYRTMAVASGEEAVEKAIETLPDLILMDIRLDGGIDGIEAARQIRDQVDIPVIYLTAFSDEALLKKAKHTEPHGYLVKPVRENELRATVEMALYKHKTDRMLKESEERYHAIMSQAIEGIFLFDLEGRILEANTAFQNLLGYSADEIQTLTIYDIVAAAPEDIDGRIQRVISEKQYPIGERQYRHKNGSLIHVEINSICISYSGKQAVCIVVHDISERKQKEAERRAMDARIRYIQKMESLGVMSGAVAHTFNNLLMVIMGYADMIVSDSEPESPFMSMAKEIINASVRANEIIRQIMVYTDKSSTKFHPVHLSRLIKEIMPLLNIPLSEQKIAIQYNMPENLPIINGDVSLLRQMIVNLITNAKEAVEENNGEIMISTGIMEADRAFLSEPYLDNDLPEGTYVTLEVTDTGNGMDKETLSKIFDPFFSTKFLGRGLGLPAVLGIVRKHRGAIKVSSNPDAGTSFKVLFPVRNGCYRFPEK